MPCPILVVLPLLFVGCLSDQEERLDVRHEVLAQAMAGHHAEAEAARDAVIQGDRVGALRALRALRNRLPLMGLPSAAVPHEAGLVAALDASLVATTLPELAVGVGEMAQACGACHTALGLSLPPAPTAPGTQTPTTASSDGAVTTAMRGHRLAVDGMWQALLAGDDDAYQEASRALLASSLVPSGTTADAPVPADAAELELRVHDLAGRAARSPEVRGRLTGELLATCATCHTRLQAGPEAAPLAPRE